MKKFLSILFISALCLQAAAQVNITKVDKVNPNDEVYMDMAVTAAQKAVADGQKPGGAVVILNGAWRSTGLPAEGVTPEENAIAKSRRTKLGGASIYTINQPTSVALNAIMQAGVDAVYFVNDAGEVIAAGIYTESDYNPETVDSSLPAVKLIRMEYAPAADLIK